jgi:ribonuclease HI
VKHVKIFTDGACSGNPGAGGWGVILDYNGKTKVLSGGEKETTNNRMELTAVVEGLLALKEKCKVTIYCDSKYITDAINKGWIYKWRESGWVNSKKEKTPNRDLWEKLLALMEYHLVTFEWIKGHAGHPENEKCDHLAVEAIKKLKID